jgi:hypothetical protein
LGGVDLASSTGKLTMNVINAVAKILAECANYLAGSSYPRSA